MRVSGNRCITYVCNPCYYVCIQACTVPDVQYATTMGPPQPSEIQIFMQVSYCSSCNHWPLMFRRQRPNAARRELTERTPNPRTPSIKHISLFLDQTQHIHVQIHTGEQQPMGDDAVASVSVRGQYKKQTLRGHSRLARTNQQPLKSLVWY